MLHPSFQKTPRTTSSVTSTHTSNLMESRKTFELCPIWYSVPPKQDGLDPRVDTI
eukprot:c45280_g1_i1 orf=145-309(-)